MWGLNKQTNGRGREVVKSEKEKVSVVEIKGENGAKGKGQYSGQGSTFNPSKAGLLYPAVGSAWLGGGVGWHVITNLGLNPGTTPSSSLHHPNQVSSKPV